MTDIPYCLTTITLRGGHGCCFAVLLNNRGRASVIGSPDPWKAFVRVDKNQAMQCTGYQNCTFSDHDSLRLKAQIQDGSTLLVTVITHGPAFEFTENIRGRYKQSLATAREWGQHLPDPPSTNLYR